MSEDFDLSEQETRQRYSAEFVDLWADAHRFLQESPGHFIRKQAEMPLGEHLDAHGYGNSFRYGFIVMLTTAAWSVPAELVWEMPAATVIAFFLGHGYEGLGGRTVPWHTVSGGSISYVRAAISALEAAGQTVRYNASVTRVRESGDSVEIVTADGSEYFDRAIIATHADDAIRLLERPRDSQRMLTEIGYNETRATLHTDRACQPAPPEKWRSWNYVRSGPDDNPQTWVNYYLNRLQDFESTTDYFLTLDSGIPIDPARIIRDFRYRHPVLTQRVRDLQTELPGINRGESRLAFAGSYFHSRKMGIDVMGNHEAAFDSGCAAAEAVLATAAAPVTG